jgi:hypothetical protein
MKKLAIIISFFAACSSDKLPKNIVEPEKMKLIVWDMLKADEYVMNKVGQDSGKTTKQRLNEMYNKVYSIHHISQDEFHNSYNYYEQHPQLHKVLMDSVYAYGNRERNNLQKTASKLIVQ